MNLHTYQDYFGFNCVLSWLSFRLPNKYTFPSTLLLFVYLGIFICPSFPCQVFLVSSFFPSVLWICLLNFSWPVMFLPRNISAARLLAHPYPCCFFSAATFKIFSQSLVLYYLIMSRLSLACIKSA